MIRTFKMMWTLWILTYTWLCSGYLVEGAELDVKCVDNCNCCRDKRCHEYLGFWNFCTNRCIDGHRSARCYELCEYSCKSCDTRIEFCDKCYDGFHLGPNKDCTSECPTSCRTCTSDTMCTACKDGYSNKNGSTTCPYALCPENCKCNGNTCTTCKSGFYDTGDECSKECPSNCASCSSREICNKCKNRFYNGYEFDNNVTEPFENCTLKCRDSCTECQSYDNCLQCIKGTYGRICQNKCSFGCKDQTCRIESGNCDCSSNFVGDKCNECVEGKYGKYCQKNCSSDCKNGICNKNSGHCRECMQNHYGPFCSEICNENCNISLESDTSSCTQFEGKCVFGCKDGFFGYTCNETCSCNCIDDVCNQETGVCLKGCTGSYEDPACTISLGKPQDVPEDNSTTTTIIVLSTLLALTTTALCILIVTIIIRKIRSPDRQTEDDSTFQIPLEHSLVVNQTQQQRNVFGVSEADNSAYEILDRPQGSHEHTYDTASANEPRSNINSGNTEYLNLQIQKS